MSLREFVNESNEMNRYQTDTLDLRLMDCMELMREYPDKHFDLAIVDPPYGIGFQGRYDVKIKRSNGSHGITSRPMHAKKQWDNKIPDNSYFEELKRVSINQIIWGGNYYHLPPCRGVICWDKLQAFESMSAWEMAWTSYDCVARIFRYDNKGFMDKDGPKIHPTQKPVALYRWLLANYAKEGMRILDTHLGSMSHAIAAHYGGVHLTGCELDPDYFAAGIARVKKETAQMTLF
jgi:site-specific DNA-methyltransferase (adenine-specific)